MNIKLPAKSYRKVLLPFSWLYQAGVTLRNKLYDKKILKSVAFSLPIVCVGNLSVGGTGKSPMVEYLIRLYKNKYRVATLSRGYKRKTKGYALANESTTALDIGDEPMQFHIKFPDISVAVGEERVVAIPLLLQDKPQTEVIILDDAFQHRQIQAGFNILLTDYGNRFTQDYYLPAGELRDNKSNYKRADVIVVTKCPADLSPHQKEQIIKEIHPLSHQKVFFVCTKYGDIKNVLTDEKKEWQTENSVLIVTGIANPKPLVEIMKDYSSGTELYQFPDHHIYSIDDFKDIQNRFEKMNGEKKIILTTQKDAVRLQKFKEELTEFPIYYIEVSHHFLFEEGSQFDKLLLDYVQNFKS